MRGPAQSRAVCYWERESTVPLRVRQGGVISISMEPVTLVRRPLRKEIMARSRTDLPRMQKQARTRAPLERSINYAAQAI